MEDLLVWAYRDQMVHGARPEGEPALGKGGPPRLATMKLLAQGGEARSNYGYEAHPDAYAVHKAVGKLGAAVVRVAPPPKVDRLSVAADLSWPEKFEVDVAGVVRAAAMDGVAPDWIPEGVGRLRDARVTIYDRTRNGTEKRNRLTGEKIGLICVVRPEGPSPWEVEKARAIYGLWWGALAALRESLGMNVRRFELTAEMPPREPWVFS